MIYVALLRGINVGGKTKVEMANDSEQRTDVMFLWNNIDDKDILKKIIIKPAIENVRYIDGALVWNIGRQNVTQGGGIKLIKTDLYKHLTIRNINTVRKLKEIMEGVKNSV
jgi:uncharacterized protein (DUF1697 family)